MVGFAFCASLFNQYAGRCCRTESEFARMSFTFITLPSLVGELKLVANGSRLAAILWEKRPTEPRASWTDD